MATEVVSASQADKPIIRRKRLSAHNRATMRTEIDTGEFGRFVTDVPRAHGGTGEGPSPLQVVVGALCGCESVTFNRTAQEMGFSYDSIDFAAEYSIDIRGRMGVRGVRQHFQTVRVEATVVTDENEDRLREAVEETEARCPVFNLINDAGVKLEVRWIRQPSSTG